MCSFASKYDHVVQFYESDAFLASVVATYLGAGLRKGTAVLEVCTTEHRRVIDAALAESGHDVARLRDEGKLIWRDARALLPKLQVGGEVNDALFQREIGESVASLSRGSCNEPLQVYGELVDLLWMDGNVKDAVKLEEMWNELSHRHTFNLLCAYRVQKPELRSVRDVCATHSQVLRPERPGYANVIDDWREREPRYGEREMVLGMRERDERLGDRLREDLTQRLLGLSLMGRSIKQKSSSRSDSQLDVLVQNLDIAADAALRISREAVPVSLGFASLSDALQSCARWVERRYGIACTLAVDPSFRDPDRTMKELVYLIVEQMINRAASDKGATQINLRVAVKQGLNEIEIWHNGDTALITGRNDDNLRWLIYQVQVLGADVDIPSERGSRPQAVFRWSAH